MADRILDETAREIEEMPVGSSFSPQAKIPVAVPVAGVEELHAAVHGMNVREPVGVNELFEEMNNLMTMLLRGEGLPCLEQRH